MGRCHGPKDTLVIYIKSGEGLVASNERSFVPAANPISLVLLSCNVVRVTRTSIKIKNCGVFEEFPLTLTYTIQEYQIMATNSCTAITDYKTSHDILLARVEIAESTAKSKLPDIIKLKGCT